MYLGAFEQADPSAEMPTGCQGQRGLYQCTRCKTLSIGSPTDPALRYRKAQIVNEALLRLGSRVWSCAECGARLPRAVPCPERNCTEPVRVDRRAPRLSLHDEAMDLIARHEARG